MTCISNLLLGVEFALAAAAGTCVGFIAAALFVAAARADR
jgi:hypothetical protein